MKNYPFFTLIGFLLACGNATESITWKFIESDLQTQFIVTPDSVVIDLPAGNYMFTRSLLLDGKNSVTIKGAGEGKTVLSFAMQTEGAEGLKVSNSTNIIFQDFTIEDAKGDNIKVTDTDGITFRNVTSQWTGEPKEENGAYALYPVICKNVLIENCTAIGASDAGIYVGQSDSVIIRNNVAFLNVAGIESENSKWVEIYGNKAYNNTGGILVFDLPGLTQYGHTTRVYNNEVYENNYRNFAPAGNIVASVPPGTGFLLLATRGIELFDNTVRDNQTIGIGVVSYVLIEAMGAAAETQLAENFETAAKDTLYNPYPNQVYVHDNRFSNSKWFPTLKNDFGLLFLTKFPFETPDIAIDGIFGPYEPLMCFENNGDARFVNLDAGNDFAGISKTWENANCQSLVIPTIY